MKDRNNICLKKPVKSCQFWGILIPVSKQNKLKLFSLKRVAFIASAVPLFPRRPSIEFFLLPYCVWVNLTNLRQFFMRLFCFWSWISSEHRESSCESADYFDNVMTKFIVNNRTDAWKTDVHLFFTIANRQIVRSRSLPHGINYKFMCLFAYWR